MLPGNLISATMQVWRRRLRSKSVESKIVELFRKDGNRQSCGLFVVDLEIELTERVEALELRVALKRGETLDRCANEAIFKRLSKRDFVLHERPSKSDPRRESSNSNHVTVA